MRATTRDDHDLARPGWGGRQRFAASGLGLYARVLAVNASILVIAVLLLIVTPISVSPSVTRDQMAVLLVGLAVMLASNAVLLRLSVAPLHRLITLMRSVDVLQPGRRLNASGTAEVAEVITVFNATLERLEEERRASMRRVLSAQEAERRRIAQELHDQIGQNLTAVVLELKRLQGRVEPGGAETLADAQELARESLEDLRRISYELRPVALDDLGLASALESLCGSVARRTGFDVRCEIDPTLPPLAPEVELAVYRVTQEALTNAVRHSGCSQRARERGHEAGRGAAAGGRRRPRTGRPADHRRWHQGHARAGARDRGPTRPGGERRGRRRGRDARARDDGREAGGVMHRSPPIRILLADDHAVVRRGLRLVLESEPDMHVVAEVGDGTEAVRRAVSDDVDLAVLDVSMPGMNGIQAVQELARLRPRLRTLILSMHSNEQYVLEAQRAGASGYVLKSVADHDLIRACRAAVRGESFVHPDTECPTRRTAEGGDEPDVALTGRESQILSLIADGHTSREIAEMLVISPRTVERHRENLRHKIGSRNQVDLTRYAIRAGLIAP